MVCFVHFDLEMCFAPQRRALFRHRNFQKWSEPNKNKGGSKSDAKGAAGKGKIWRARSVLLKNCEKALCTDL